MTVPKNAYLSEKTSILRMKGHLGPKWPNFRTRGVDFRTRGVNFRTGGGQFPHEGPNFRTRGVDFRTTGADFRTRGHDFRTRGPGGPVGPASFGSDASEVEINECRKFYRFFPKFFLDIYQTRRFLEFRTIIVLSV